MSLPYFNHTKRNMRKLGLNSISERGGSLPSATPQRKLKFGMFYHNFISKQIIAAKVDPSLAPACSINFHKIPKYGKGGGGQERVGKKFERKKVRIGEKVKLFSTRTFFLQIFFEFI